MRGGIDPEYPLGMIALALVVSSLAGAYPAGVALEEGNRHLVACRPVIAGMKYQYAMSEAQKADDIRLRLKAMYGLAVSQYELGNRNDAEKTFSRLVFLQDAELGKNADECPDLANTLHALASIHAETGRLDSAETLYLRSIAAFERCSGEKSHFGFMAKVVKGDQAFARAKMGRAGEGERELRRQLSDARAQDGVESWSASFAELRLAAFLRARGMKAEASALEKHAAPIREKGLADLKKRGMDFSCRWYSFLFR